MNADRAAAVPAIRVTSLTKTYGRIQALRDVDLVLAPGTVTALVGENGAGKSTALGCIAGRTAPTSGTIEVFGEDLRPGDPRAARAAGVMAIYQELTVVPTLSAEANVFLSAPPSRGGFLSERTARKRYVELCAEMGVRPVPSNTLALKLSTAEQQVLEILRALAYDARVILFDEPTASLALPERSALLDLMGRLRDRGVALAFVSHNMDEVLEISDQIVVFRNGAMCANGARSEFDKHRLVSAMLGDEADPRVAGELLAAEAKAPVVSRASRRPSRNNTPLLVAENVTVPHIIGNVTVELRQGEVLGIGGLVGSGRSTLMRALAGAEPASSGKLWLDGRAVAWPRSVRQAIKLGIALVPEDRKTLGLVLPMAAMDNIALPDFGRAGRRGVVSSRSISRATQEVGADFGFNPQRLKDPASNLSGGNQQKLLLARWAYRQPVVLLADEPTRGIDVGAKADILDSLERMADNGVGIIIVSSELEEVCAIAERAIVLSEGRCVGSLDGSDAITPESILRLAFAGHSTDETQPNAKEAR